MISVLAISFAYLIWMVYRDFYHFSGSYRSINVKFVKVLIMFSLLSAEKKFRHRFVSQRIDLLLSPTLVKIRITSALYDERTAN